MRELLIGHRAERALDFQRMAVRRLGPAPGIFLRQLVFWDGRGMYPDGWMYKSIGDWQDETGLSRRQQEKARKALVGKGFIAEKHALGPDRRQRLFFRANLSALLDFFAGDLTAEDATLNGNSRVPGISEQGTCPPSRAGTAPGSSGPANTEEDVRRDHQDPPGGEHDSQPLQVSKEEKRVCGNGLVTVVAGGLRGSGQPFDGEQMRDVGKNFKRLIESGVPDGDLHRAAHRLVAEWPEGLRSPGKALDLVRGAGSRRSDDSEPESRTPEAGIAALRDYWSEKKQRNDLGEYAALAERWDFTREDRPPWPVYSELGYNDEERDRMLKRLRTVTRRAVREGGTRDLDPLDVSTQGVRRLIA